MDFKDQIKQLSARIDKVKYNIDTLDDIYTHADELKAEVARFVSE